MPLMDRVDEYLKLGFAVIPSSGKVPTVKWERFASKANFEELRKLFVGRSEAKTNIATILGPPSNNLVCIDIDDRTLADRLDLEKIRKVGCFVSITGKKGMHIYFRVNEIPPNTSSVLVQKTPNGQIEFRIHNSVAILPPSIHPDTKKRYVWAVFSPSIAMLEWSIAMELFSTLVEKAGGSFQITRKEKLVFGDVKEAIEMEYPLLKLEKLPKYLQYVVSLKAPNGERNKTAHAISQLLFFHGWLPNEVTRVMYEWYKKHKSNDFSFDEVISAIKSKPTTGGFYRYSLTTLSKLKVFEKAFKKHPPEWWNFDILAYTRDTNPEEILDAIERVEIIKGEGAQVQITFVEHGKPVVMILPLTELGPYTKGKTFLRKYFELFVRTATLDKDAWDMVRMGIIQRAVIRGGSSVQDDLSVLRDTLTALLEVAPVVNSDDEYRSAITRRVAFKREKNKKLFGYIPLDLLVDEIRRLKSSRDTHFLKKVYLFLNGSKMNVRRRDGSRVRYFEWELKDYDVANTEAKGT